MCKSSKARQYHEQHFHQTKEETTMTMKWKGWALATGVLAISALARPHRPRRRCCRTPAPVVTAPMAAARADDAQPGQPVEEAIEAAMKKFKSGERPSTVMGRLAKGYSDARN
jgi:hypothetical protein